MQSLSDHVHLRQEVEPVAAAGTVERIDNWEVEAVDKLVCTAYPSSCNFGMAPYFSYE